MAPFASLLAAVVLVLAAPIAQADTLLYVDHLGVYDANGTRIGSAWPRDDAWLAAGFSEPMVVEFRLRSMPIVALFNPTGFESPPLYFTNAGCTGDMLIDPFWGRFTAVAGARSTVYVQSGPIRELIARSTRLKSGVCRDHAPITHGFGVLRATETDLADHFVPPFTIRTRARTRVPVGAP
jgi:hypothetical protein